MRQGARAESGSSGERPGRRPLRPVQRRLAIAAVVLAGVLVLAAVAGFLVVVRGPAGGVVQLFAEGQRAERFRSLHDALPSHAIRAGDEPWAFEREVRQLPSSFEYAGEERGVADFLRASETTGLLVARDGVILHEAYFQGYDERSLPTSFSVAKSFVSALVGIAVERGYVASVEDAISDYVPALVGSPYEGVAIRDVLRMSSGVAFDERYDSLASDVMRLPLQLFVLRRGVEDVLRRLERARPAGTVHDYVSSDALALGLLVTHATGRSLPAFLEETLWRPAGMEADAAWNTDLHGQALSHAFLSATLRDYARFGRLYLNEGRRDDRQVVPAAWVAASLRPTATRPPPEAQPAFGASLGYGYQWWLADGPDGAFLAMGIWGQFVYVHPGLRVVIVKTSTDPGFAAREGETLALFGAIARAMGGAPAAAR